MTAVHVISIIDGILKYANIDKNMPVKLGSYDGAWYTEDNGSILHQAR